MGGFTLRILKEATHRLLFNSVCLCSPHHTNRAISAGATLMPYFHRSFRAFFFCVAKRIKGLPVNAT